MAQFNGPEFAAEGKKRSAPVVEKSRSIDPDLRLKIGVNPTLRAAVIAEWRGLPEPRRRPDQFRATAELMPAIMRRLGLNERLHETEVIDAWAHIVGDFIAAHSAPVALREGILYVRVLQPALHYQFEQISKPDILRKLKQRFGARTIRDVRFRLG